MINTDKVIAILRPFLSAIVPNIHPPIGLIKKPTAKIAAVFSSCAVASPLGKKTGAKYNANAEYAYQSYHSTRFPTDPLSKAWSLDFKVKNSEGKIEN